MNSVAQKNQSAINTIAYCIENDEKGIRALLKRNGVQTDTIITKRGLTKAFINALAKSKSLGVDFVKYLNAKKKSHVMSMSKYSNFINPAITEGLGGLGEDIKNSQDYASEDAVKSGGFFSGLNLKDLINSGIQVLEIQKDMQVSKDNKDSIEKAVQAKRDELNLKPDPTKSGMSTGTIVVIGIIGFAVVGGIIWALTKKK